MSKDLAEMLLKGLSGAAENEAKLAAMPTVTPALIVAAGCTEYLKEKSFAPGTVVTSCAGFDILRYPKHGLPAIVIESKQEELDLDEIKPGRRYDKQLADVRIGVIDDNGDFGTFWVSSVWIEELGEHPENASAVAMAHELKELYDEFCKRHEFKPGNMVKWKTKMKNRRFPRYQDVAMFVKYLPEKIMDEEEDSGNPDWKKEYDCVIAVVNPDGKMASFIYDSELFTLAEQGLH